MRDRAIDPPGSIYIGDVVHARLQPKRHRLRYKVAALAVDVDRIDALSKTVRGFSYNAFNLMSLHDRDHGDGAVSIADGARAVLKLANLDAAGAQITLLCYPRILGYAFNPISVYYCRDDAGELAAVIYEVNNTFGERKSYVVAAGQASTDGIFRQTSEKQLSVSPFTPGAGHYTFHILPPAERVSLGIQYRLDNAAILRTHFVGCQRRLTPSRIAGLVAVRPWRTLEVMAAIHWEAARLYLKGVPLIPRHRSPRFSVWVPKPAPDDAPKTRLSGT